MQVFVNKHDLGDIVYLKCDEDQKKRIVTALIARQSGLEYELSCGTTASNHYDFEISIERDVLITTNS